MVGMIQEQLSLAEIARREVEKYVASSDNANFYSILDDQQQTYAVVVVPNTPRPFPVEIVVMARVVNDHIVIDEDTTDKPLVDALMVNGGIPREQIILAYVGEMLSYTKT